MNDEAQFQQAHAVIGLTLSNELFENVREVNSYKEMWAAIRNVVCSTQILHSRQEENESVLKFSNANRVALRLSVRSK